MVSQFVGRTLRGLRLQLAVESHLTQEGTKRSVSNCGVDIAMKISLIQDTNLSQYHGEECTGVKGIHGPMGNVPRCSALRD